MVGGETSQKPALPRHALRWIIENSVCSDTQLAVFSNVCSSWRKWVLEFLLEMSSNDSFNASVAELPVYSLLLPSMMRAFVEQPQMKRHGISTTSDHFCVAWFASEGIQELSWSQLQNEDAILERIILEAQDSAASRDLTHDLLDTNHSESEDECTSNSQNHSRVPISTTQRLEEQALRSAHQTSFQWQRKGRIATLSNEWRGYRAPYEVLHPFGYSATFVEEVFKKLSEDRRTTIPATVESASNDYSRASFAVRGATVARPESYCMCIDHIDEAFGNQQQRLQRLRDRKDLRRTVLPRVIRRVDHPPAVQFLNVDKSSAVTLMTPSLACGILKEPFTIFLVGIATEDGCFLSGLRHRFEIGHLYPRDKMAEITDSSGICVFIEDWSPVADVENMEDDGEPADNENEEMWDEDDLLRESQINCRCVFNGITEKLPEMDDPDDEDLGRLARGLLGPGTWHCYTVIVDETETVIRIDGVQEPMEVHQKRQFSALLDGLTLGSDHCFGTSLCCGQGSPGEGEGALAEVAVFCGRMDICDVTKLEAHLMRKHRIAPQTKDPWLDDDLYRQARAMFQLVGNPRGNRVPLQFFTKSPNVAWKLYHPVTEQIIKRERIGARNDESSSEW